MSCKNCLKRYKPTCPLFYGEVGGMRFFTPSSENDDFCCKLFETNGRSTIKKLISKVNLPMDISEVVKYRWLGEIDGKRYCYPEDADTELLYEDNVYEKYLIAMCDFVSGDMSAYERSAREFVIAFNNRKDVRQ